MAEYYRPRVPKGQHLGNSREQGDGVVGHLFDDENKLKGHAVWEKVEVPDEDDYSAASYESEPTPQLTQEEIERAAEMAALLIIGIIKGVQWASPRVKQWWDGKAAPALTSAWRRLRKQDAKATPEPLDLGRLQAKELTFVASSAGIEMVVAESKIKMSSAEWEQRLKAMLAASAFQEEQRRILSNAQIEDEVHAIGPASTTDELTPQQFADRVQAMLQANPSLLTEASSAELIKVFRANAKRDDDEGDLALSL